jgi:hypothetical protein
MDAMWCYDCSSVLWFRVVHNKEVVIIERVRSCDNNGLSDELVNLVFPNS